MTIPSIEFFLDDIHKNVTSRFDELVLSAFGTLGYSPLWILENKDRISIDRIVGAPSIECEIYKIDGKQVFSIQQLTKIDMENDIYRFVANWEVKYFKEGESHD